MNLPVKSIPFGCGVFDWQSAAKIGCGSDQNSPVFICESGQLNSVVVVSLVGLTGFEPATSWSRSNPTRRADLPELPWNCSSLPLPEL